MQRVKADAQWSLFCPNAVPRDLSAVYGAEFEALYTQYEREGRAKRTLPARLLWQKMLTSMIETGTPYLLFKDAVNRKSNQQNVGTIRSSNLCCEIMEVSTPSETAVCNLASLALPARVKSRWRSRPVPSISTTTSWRLACCRSMTVAFPCRTALASLPPLAMV